MPAMFLLGQRVCHSAFGYGVIIKTAKDLVTVHFDDNTDRTVVPSMSALVAVLQKAPNAQATKTSNQNRLRAASRRN